MPSSLTPAMPMPVDITSPKPGLSADAFRQVPQRVPNGKPAGNQPGRAT